jgi:hypothetical protein
MKLTNENIRETLKEFEIFFEKAGVSKKDRMKIELLVGEILARYQKNFSADHEFTVHMKKWFSVPKLIIRIQGKKFDPFQNLGDNSSGDIFTNAVIKNPFQYESAETVYRYENGYNELIAFSTKEKKTY